MSVEFGRGYASPSDRAARQAFVHTLRGVIDPRGQRVSARDRLYLASELPTLFVWGARDRIIPPGHGRQAHDEVPGSRLEILPEAGRFPHLDAPQAFVSTLSDFIESTEAAELNVDNVRERLKAGEAIPQEEGDHGATGIPVD